MLSLSLDRVAGDIAGAIKAVDATHPVFGSYKPGIGPHPEDETVKLIVKKLKETAPDAYGEARVGVAYPIDRRQRCDLVLPAQNGDWHFEIKPLRILGNNGKLNDYMLKHILSPYPEHRSAVTDCGKLLRSGFDGRIGIIIYGYDDPRWPAGLALDAFECLSAVIAKLSKRSTSRFEELVHPIHQSGVVAGWEILR